MPIDVKAALSAEPTVREANWTERDVLLKGSILVVVRARDGSPRAGMRVTIRGCGFV